MMVSWVLKFLSSWEKKSKPAKIWSHLAPYLSATDSAVFPSSSCLSRVLSVLKPGMVSVLDERTSTTPIADALRGPQGVPAALHTYQH